ncbi:MAG: beta-ketoacyl synthase chain length factor [Flavobacteriales bacterium]|nr:beta-ketoacyl synthase chain length factor [Flavobacteriales bacterium]MCX7768484.1 beta-ketoacyl synthase chain length factor [Flavobacteriales bacterium]MDW8409817.1 beta-ketoacyl synthase chain length factor [Flavobacteriales bacterium]
MKALFILGKASISPQGFGASAPLPPTPYTYEERALVAVEPDYKEEMSPLDLRRMNKSMKMGVWCAKKALGEAGIPQPDAIITATGLGCLQDTVNFLKTIIDSDETAQAPTYFISSTHNSVSGQLALRLKSTLYNYTYCHKSLSLYSALLDASLHAEENSRSVVLVGALDEHVDVKFRHYDLRGWWRKEPVHNLRLYQESLPGTLSGEGCHYFVLSASPSEGVAITRMAAVEEANESQIERLTMEMLEGQSEKETLVLLGLSGDEPSDGVYHKLRRTLLSSFVVGAFRHLCGVYHTSDGFALYLADQVLRDASAPAYLFPEPLQSLPIVPRSVVIYTHLRGSGHVWYRLEKL